LIKHSYFSKRFDEAAILSSLARVAFSSEAELLEQDYAVLAALRRSSDEWELSIAETSDRLSSYNDEQIGGLVNNVKGILHEMEFQRLENEDGDSVVASLYPDTNHKGVDIQMMDISSGDAWSVQLKATDDMSAINSWMDSNPDTEILVTEELSEKMGISSSGFSNEDMTIRVEDFVDRMLELYDSDDPALWETLPPLVAASAGIIVFELWRRYRADMMSLEEFRNLTLKTVGLKAGKYAVLFGALSVPGLNVVVGAYLLGSLILAVGTTLDKVPTFKPFSFLATH
jgi:hypothetical protein